MNLLFFNADRKNMICNFGWRIAWWRNQGLFDVTWTCFSLGLICMYFCMVLCNEMKHVWYCVMRREWYCIMRRDKIDFFK